MMSKLTSGPVLEPPLQIPRSGTAPYSPDLNNIDEIFSYVKNFSRKHDPFLQVINNPTDVINSAFAAVAPQLCLSWIGHSGYRHYST